MFYAGFDCGLYEWISLSPLSLLPPLFLALAEVRHAYSFVDGCLVHDTVNSYVWTLLFVCLFVEIAFV